MNSAQTIRISSYVAHADHGPLPAILLLLTAGTGIIDAVSILGLGRVFVANMTGNIVFIGFALAGAPGFSLAGSIAALAAFLVGAAVGGVLISRWASHRGRLLRNALLIQVGLLAIAAIITAVTIGPVWHLLVLALTAFSLGIQNSVVRQLAVPDMTTTVLTLTLTGIAADLRKRNTATAFRRTLSVTAMLLGALIGAILVLNAGVLAALAASLSLTAVATVLTIMVSRNHPAWAVTDK